MKRGVFHEFKYARLDVVHPSFQIQHNCILFWICCGWFCLSCISRCHFLLQIPMLLPLLLLNVLPWEMIQRNDYLQRILTIFFSISCSTFSQQIYSKYMRLHKMYIYIFTLLELTFPFVFASDKTERCAYLWQTNDKRAKKKSTWNNIRLPPCWTLLNFIWKHSRHQFH